MSNIERGTRIHLSYQEAYRKEQVRGRIAFLTWVALILFVSPFINHSGWFTAWLFLLVLFFLFLITHWDKDAVRARAFHNSDKEKPL